ncbi:hypothetical protein BKP37_00615 [Anaerobacillus alkalilacustris]|uniref:Uncharacterized protein n=1 Tax=Anaerobacillus alkalilacustris TaxID=393763 RepID=A0A1S2LXK7_9BACI|nr:hypothetical protein [Anaerobacillus alkalilacustris]OIJ17076.1 hypothetical protein BKP37_00615 [Anaerobacillus alkalilacustris]
MSKITVSVNVDSAEELASTILELAATLTPNTGGIFVETDNSDKTETKPTSNNKQEEKADKEEPQKFTKASYFHHPESDSYLAFKKGDLVPTDADFELCKEITKKDYDKGIAAQEEANKKEDPSTDDVPSVVDLRAKAQEKATSPEAKKAIKALLDEFESKSISDVPEDKRVEFLARLEDL